MEIFQNHWPTFAVWFLLTFCSACLNAAPPATATVSKAVAFYASSIRSLAGNFECRIETTDAFVSLPGSATFEDQITDFTFLADLLRCRTRLDEQRTWKYSWMSPDQTFVLRELNT
jgi:hypothetical protein